MRKEPRVLNLTIKKEYFDLIKTGKKRVEYRRISQFYISRFEGKTYDQVIFRNGYAIDSPRICLQVLKIVRKKKTVKGIHYGCYEIHLGKLLKVN